MSRVDFYILPEGSGVDRFACSIASKAWANGHRVHIHTQSEETATVVDNLLWTYRDISFVPHEIFDGNSHDETPVTIGYGEHYPEPSQVMINLGTEIPAFAANFDRVVEIVGGTESNKQAARLRYRQYKGDNYESMITSLIS